MATSKNNQLIKFKIKVWHDSFAGREETPFCFDRLAREVYSRITAHRSDGNSWNMVFSYKDTGFFISSIDTRKYYLVLPETPIFAELKFETFEKSELSYNDFVNRLTELNVICDLLLVGGVHNA